MKNSKLKLSIILLFIMAVTLPITAFSAPIKRLIEITYNNISIIVDGQKINLGKDSNGNEIQPFVHNGVTYLPVRAVAEALNKDVSWDGKTQTVFIGKKDISDTDVVYFGNGIEHMSFYQEKGDKGLEYKFGSEKPSLTNTGAKYNNFLLMKITGGYSDNGYAYVDIPTNIEYNYMETVLSWPDSMKEYKHHVNITIYGDDKIIFEKTLSPGDMPSNINLNIEGVVKVRMKASFSEVYYNSPTVGFYDLRFIK